MFNDFCIVLLRLGPPTREMTVHMVAAVNVFSGDNFVLSFPTGCLGWDIGL